MSADPRPAAGFTLIESMLALVVVSTASVGAIAALLHAGKELRHGQQRQGVMLLVEAKAQVLRLADKSHLDTGTAGLPAAVAYTSATPPDQLPVGSAPWVPDPRPPQAGDLASGAYFRIDGLGNITAVDAATAPAGTACNQVPAGTWCREVLVTRNLPAGTGGIATGGTPIGNGDNGQVLPPGAQPYTVWTRISHAGDPGSTVVARELVIP